MQRWFIMKISLHYTSLSEKWSTWGYIWTFRFHKLRCSTVLINSLLSVTCVAFSILQIEI